MSITFVSNYINHHQIPFSEALYQKLGKDYHFIQTMPMEEERVAMGWGVDIGSLPYVRCLYEEEYECRKLIAESDVVLFGWTQRPDIEAERLDSDRLTIRVSERLYREGQWKAVSPRGLYAKYKEHIRYRHQNVYLLCAGAYTASDFHLIGAYPGKMFRWGYFPETRIYPKEIFAGLKEDGPLQIVWAGRFIPLKHPEYVVRLAGRLLQEGYDFRVHMLGSGEMEEDIKRQVSQAGLAERFVFYGYQAPGKVRDVMERCHIHLFTSNYLEGWGAVVNEGMNSGCVEVVNAQTGAAPYLIEHGVNGLVYPDDSYPEMEKLVLDLFANWPERKQMGAAAYQTILREWNAQHAADELLRFTQGLLKGDVVPAESGPLSIAPAIAPKKMYGAMMSGKI
ncbi:MAG: glycosyltransferase [Roseburia sp.]|nr:glycosyltransferase [Roseburia sp.]MCM1241716.1 glycosyltransferase [Roseburia sp.]